MIQTEWLFIIYFMNVCQIKATLVSHVCNNRNKLLINYTLGADFSSRHKSIFKLKSKAFVI